MGDKDAMLRVACRFTHQRREYATDSQAHNPLLWLDKNTFPSPYFPQPKQRVMLALLVGQPSWISEGQKQRHNPPSKVSFYFTVSKIMSPLFNAG
jgi:hypothetical protein